MFLRKTKGTFFPGLDALRVYSILFVLIAHVADSYFSNNPYNEAIYELLENGSNGVRIFFGISGLVIFHSLNRKVINLSFYLSFISKRFRRLEPAYLIIISGTFFCYSILFNKLDYLAVRHWLASLFYLHGIIYEKPAYFFPHAWSLEIEFWFYLLAPFLCYF